MGERRRRLTLGHLMLVTGVAALVFAMTRVEATPGVSLFLFAACSWYLASRRFAETMAERSTQGLTTSRAQKSRILASSAGLAVVAIGLPDAAFLAGYYGYMEAIRALCAQPFWTIPSAPVLPSMGYPAIRTTMPMAGWNPYLDLTQILAGSLAGLIAALSVASIVRQCLGPIVGRKPAKRARPVPEPVRSHAEPEPEPECVSTRG
jgi:hypothetical protein